MKKHHLISTSAVLSILFSAFLITPALASSGHTYYVNSTAGSDANNCTAASTPCLTISAAKTLLINQADPSNSTIKLSGTFTEAIAFSASDVTLPDTLNGLHITSTDKAIPATISAAGLDVAVSMNGVENAELDHLIIDGGVIGMSVKGTASALANNISIHDNTIQNQTDTASGVTGLALYYLNHTTVKNNTITGGSYTVTDATDYDNMYAVYLQSDYDLTFSGNTISNYSAVNTGDMVGSHTWYLYGVYVYGGTDLTLFDNTITGLSAMERGTFVGANQSAYVHGLYFYNITDLTLRTNVITASSATTIPVGAGSAGTSSITGLVLNNIRQYHLKQSVVRGTTLSNLTATSTTPLTATSTVSGMDISYLNHLTIRDTTITGLDAHATTSEANGNERTVAYGINGPTSSSAVVVDRTAIKQLNATIDYTGMNGSSSYALYPITSFSSDAITIKHSNISVVTATTNNGNSSSFYDYGNAAGINLSGVTHAVVKDNTVHDMAHSYGTTGTNGLASFNQSGYYFYNTPDIKVVRNVYRTTTFNSVISDATATSYSYAYLYGIYASYASHGLFKNNRVSAMTNTVTAADGNMPLAYTYPILIANSAAPYVTRNTIKHITTTAGSATTGYNYVYGLDLINDSGAVAQHNTIAHVSATTPGSSAYSVLEGLVVNDAQSVYLDANFIHHLNNTAGNQAGEQLYGIHFNADANDARLTNNIILGSDDTATHNTGMYLAGKNTKSAYIYHNTVSHWLYPLYLAGGDKLRVINNIFSAAGADSYSIVVSWDNLNQAHFRSDYNVLYNTTQPEQLIYNNDTALVIPLVNWAYDTHSVKKNPQLTATGKLKKNSPARQAGLSTLYNLDGASFDYSLIVQDLNGDARLPASDHLVDIGADQYSN